MAFIHRIPVLHKSKLARYASRVHIKQDPSVEDMEKFIRMTESKALGFDPWAQPAPMFDLHVPTPWSALFKRAGLREGLKFVGAGLQNKISNAISMFKISRSHSLPWNPTVSPYSPQIFRSSSTKPNTWLEPLRHIAGDTYEQVNKAVATNDIETVRKLSIGAYQKTLLSRMKSLHPVGLKRASQKARSLPTPVWRLHSFASPIQCVSIRSEMGNLAKRDPLIGTRYLVQACFKFDTLQSLAVSPSSPPSEPKRVREYLVLEKKMWYDSPWVIRDQLWEGVLGESNTGQDIVAS